MAYTNKKFVEYMEEFKDSHEEGKDVTYQAIMSKSERKYNVRGMSNE
jgi:hypothetical protein